MAGIKIYRIVTLGAPLAHNVVTGIVAAPAAGTSLNTDKGVEATFQNQSTGAFPIYIGDSNLTISIGATSTTGNGGIMLNQFGSFSFGKRDTTAGANMTEWYIASTSSQAVCVVLLNKAI